MEAGRLTAPFGRGSITLSEPTARREPRPKGAVKRCYRNDRIYGARRACNRLSEPFFNMAVGPPSVCTDRMRFS